MACISMFTVLFLCLLLTVSARAAGVGQLLVLDSSGSATTVKVVSLANGVVTGNLSFPITPAMYSSESGRYAFINLRSLHRLHVYDSGMYTEAHEDHHHLITKPSRMLRVTLTELSPTHVTAYGVYTSIYNDGSGTVSLVHEPTLAAMDNRYQPTILSVGRGHGAATYFNGNAFAISSPRQQYHLTGNGSSLPTGVQVWELRGVVYHLARMACPELHGESFNGNVSLWGCSDGLLAVARVGRRFTHFKISYPRGFTGRLGTTWGHDSQRNFFAGSAAIGLFHIDITARTMKLAYNATVDSFVGANVMFDHVGRLVVLFRSGNLRLFSAATGKQMKRYSVIPAVSKTDTMPPRLALGFGKAYISVPSLEKVYEVNLESGTVTRMMTVGGKPTLLVTLGPKEHYDHLE